ncbi:hypothetical protein Tco_0386023 [Tanacetum coccineum]
MGLHEEQQISGFIHGLRTRSLVENLSTDLPSTYKGLMEKTYTWVEARERTEKQRQILLLKENSSHREGLQEASSHLQRCSETPQNSDSRGRKLGVTFTPRETNKERKDKVIRHHTGESKKDKGDCTLERLSSDLWVQRENDTATVSGLVLAGRTAMQMMGIVVLTIYEAIKFHTEKGIGIVFSTNKVDEGAKRARRIHATNKEWILSCINAEEKIIVNDKYPDQTVTIGRQLPNHFKKELQNLLKSNADVFAWTHADMTGIPRTIMVEGKPFNTKHKLNEYSHIKPIKQNKRGLGPDRNMAACKEIEELTKAGILQKLKH